MTRPIVVHKVGGASSMLQCNKQNPPRNPGAMPHAIKTDLGSCVVSKGGLGRVMINTIHGMRGYGNGNGNVYHRGYGRK